MPKRSNKIGFWLNTSLVVGTIFIALMLARFSKMITKAVGPNAYSREGFGDFAGFLVLWGYWISIWSGNYY